MHAMKAFVVPGALPSSQQHMQAKATDRGSRSPASSAFQHLIVQAQSHRFLNQLIFLQLPQPVRLIHVQARLLRKKRVLRDSHQPVTSAAMRPPPPALSEPRASPVRRTSFCHTLLFFAQNHVRIPAV
jgi:hypothetical protein